MPFQESISQKESNWPEKGPNIRYFGQIWPELAPFRPLLTVLWSCTVIRSSENPVREQDQYDKTARSNVRFPVLTWASCSRPCFCSSNWKENTFASARLRQTRPESDITGQSVKFWPKEVNSGQKELKLSSKQA